jgi:hypothetical protein
MQDFSCLDTIERFGVERIACEGLAETSLAKQSPRIAAEGVHLRSPQQISWCD